MLLFWYTACMPLKSAPIDAVWVYGLWLLAR